MNKFYYPPYLLPEVTAPVALVPTYAEPHGVKLRRAQRKIDRLHRKNQALLDRIAALESDLSKKPEVGVFWPSKAP